MKQRLLNLWLLAVMMIVGSSAAWADAGETTTLLEYGTADAPWTAETLAEWTAGGNPTLADGIVTISGGNGGYATSKTISPTANVILNVQAVWRGRSNTGRAFSVGNCSYFRVGNILVAHNDQDKKHGYGFAGLDNTTSVTTFSAGSYRVDIADCTWLLIDMEINTATKTLTSFSIKSEDGSITYVEKKNVVLSNVDFTTVAFGYHKIKSVSTANTEQLKSVKITQTTQDAEFAEYTLKAMAGNEELTTLASGIDMVGGECVFNGLSKLIVKDGKYYKLKEQTGLTGCKFSFVKASGNETVNLQYELVPSVAYFAEAESLGNITAADKDECSGGKYAHVNSDKAASLITLKPGKYTAIGCLAPAADNGRGDRGIYFRNGGVADNTENVIVNCGTNKSSAPGEYTTEEFTLTESTAVTLTGWTTSDGKTNQSAEIDYVYITRNANLVLPGYYGKAAELTGNVNDDYSITLNGSTLTVSTRKPGYGFQKIKLFTSKFDGVTVSEGRLDDKAVWTGDAEEVVFTLNGSTVNAIAINDAEIPTASVVNNISAFKATDAQSGMKLINADVRAITDEGTVIEDDGAGILLKGIFIPGAAVGKRLTGTITGIYDPAKRAMVSTELTDCTTPVVNTISGRGAREISNAEALTDVNSFRLVKLNTLTVNNGGASVSDSNNTTIKLDNTLFADMATLIGNANSMISLTGVVYYNGTENVLMPRSASDIVLGSIEQSFADGKAYNPGDEIASNTGVVMTFGGEKSDENVYKFETLDAPVNGYTTGTAGISEGTSYQFDALRNGTLVVTVALEAGKKLSVVCDGEELENDSYQFDGNVITLPVETGKTYIISAVDSNLGLMGYEYQVSDLTAPAVAKNISVFRNMVYGTEAKLMLNDAVVTYIKGDNVFVEDASGAIDFYETQVQFYVGQKLNGYIIGENNVQDNMPVLLRTAATPTSKFTAEKGTVLSKVATVAEALQENSLARFVMLRNLNLSKDKMGLKILIDEAGDTIYIEDRFSVLYDLPNKVKHIDGIVGVNNEGVCHIWPTSKEGVVGELPMEQLADGKYLLRNVASGLYLGAANNWGTRATLMNYSEYVTLKAIDAETYTIESQVSNGGTSYYFNGSYMDGAATNVTLAKDGKYYTIKSNDKFIGFSTKEPAYVTGMYALDLDIDGESREALWEIIPATADALNGASMSNPVDATFMVLNPNFGRNNRNASAWTISASNQNLSGGTNENRCAESYHSTFTLNQTITGLPVGTYQLTAQGFYRQDGTDNENLPYFYVNDQKQTFPVKTGSENSMNDASASFAKGLYTIDPITVTIVDGILNIGAKNENDALWCIWDNFQLKYCGTANVTIDMFVDAYETALAAANQLVNEKMSKTALDQLNDAIAAEVDKTSEESLSAATKALNDAIEAAQSSIESYKILAAGTLADNDMTGWTCTNSNTFHINTWSVEGNEGNDPSGMVTPFIENWVGKPGPLGEGKIFYTLKNINPSEVKVTALVRIYSESGEEPQGASFFVGNQKVDIATVGTSFEYNGMKGIYGTIEATGTTLNGDLVFGIELALPTFNWVAIKNVTIVATEKDDIPAKTLNFTPEYWNNTNVQMELGTTEVAKAWDTANKVDQPLYNVTMPEEFSGSLALQAVKDWADETKGWWLRSAAGGLYAYGARRPAAITNLKAGNYVVFTCTRDASGVITLLNGEGQPDGPYTFEKDAQGRYCCTMTANGNLGFCGVMNVGYIKTIDIYNAKPVVTGIENVQSRLSGTEAIYNLRGQKVTGTLKPGLYIKNGKKVVIK